MMLLANTTIFGYTAYPSEFYGPTGLKASQAQAFTFLVRDQRLRANVGSAQGPTDLGKYLMRSPTGEVIFGGETMRFWDLHAPWLEPLRGPNDGVWNVLKRCHRVQPKYRVGLGSFCSGSGMESLSIRHPLRGTSTISDTKLAVWQTNPQFQVQLTFGAGVAWSSCLSSRFPRVTCCHRYNPAVTRTSCALAKYGASDLCPEQTNSIGSSLSPGQTCCH
ncbi:hypothetical protein PIB30_044646 [Stylosanthes scabra]|uniref:Uncharacterized protein n=1 Tax=Stylosanthes scabra TaxID=79078 RepID=A0ABU6WIN6_9FABA|nr:hypothetical protein [Stylosanthes scabra]